MIATIVTVLVLLTLFSMAAYLFNTGDKHTEEMERERMKYEYDLHRW